MRRGHAALSLSAGIGNLLGSVLSSVNYEPALHVDNESLLLLFSAALEALAFSCMLLLTPEPALTHPAFRGHAATHAFDRLLVAAFDWQRAHAGRACVIAAPCTSVSLAHVTCAECAPACPPATAIATRLSDGATVTQVTVAPICPDGRPWRHARRQR